MDMPDREGKKLSAGQLPQANGSDDFLWHFPTATPIKATPTTASIRTSALIRRFSHEHWWNAKRSIPAEAVFWELFRRQPQVGFRYLNHPYRLRRSDEWYFLRAIAYIDNSTKGLARHLISLCGCSWPKLEPQQHQDWREYLNMVGSAGGEFQPEPAIRLDRYIQAVKQPPANHASLSEMNLLERVLFWSEYPHLAPPAEPNSSALGYESINERWLKLLPTHGRLLEKAIEHEKHGRILLAIDPMAPGLGKIVEVLARKCRKGKPARRIGKMRSDQWLDVIEKFESHELSRESSARRNDQLFARYRRILTIRDWLLTE